MSFRGRTSQKVREDVHDSFAAHFLSTFSSKNERCFSNCMYFAWIKTGSKTLSK